MMRSSAKRHASSWLFLIFLILLGVFFMWIVAQTVIRNERTSLAHRAATVAAGIDPSEVRVLSVSAADLGTPAYEHLKTVMTRVKRANDDVRFVYLLAMRPEGVTFIGDSEDPASEDYSPPGDVYYEATPLLRSVFESKTAVVEGPEMDRWGTWVSGLAPIIDEQGTVVAIAGLDIDARAYYRSIAVYTSIPFLLTLLMVIVAMYGQRLRAKERELFRTRFRFLSVASHELRSPLAGVALGAEELLNNETTLSEKAHRTLERIRDAARYMSETVSDILSSARAQEPTSSTLFREVIDISALIRETATILSLYAEKDGMHIVYERGFPEHIFYPADKEKMRRIFSNIIGNALKYSNPDGTITLGFGRDKDGYVFSVADNGIGIPQEDQEKIFATYYRAKNAERHSAQGTGMGLYFTKELVEMHGGRIWFTSHEGAGTTMFVFFPDMKVGVEK